MDYNNRISLFDKLGSKLSAYLKDGFPTAFEQAIEQSKQHNPWFTEAHILFAIKSISELLEKDKLSQWLEPYNLKLNESKTCKSGGYHGREYSPCWFSRFSMCAYFGQHIYRETFIAG